MRIREYVEGLWADVHGHPADAGEIVLLWHGRGPSERDVLEPIASALTTVGRLVVVPDWDSTAYDGGRTARFADWFRPDTRNG